MDLYVSPGKVCLLWAETKKVDDLGYDIQNIAVGQ
jgi:hypothetical protein